MADDGFTTVRVRTADRERLRQLAERVAQHGWSAIGVKRNDKPSMANVLEEALNKLERK